jgi:hypothetical protein
MKTTVAAIMLSLSMVAPATAFDIFPSADLASISDSPHSSSSAPCGVTRDIINDVSSGRMSVNEDTIKSLICWSKSDPKDAQPLFDDLAKKISAVPLPDDPNSGPRMLVQSQHLSALAYIGEMQSFAYLHHRRDAMMIGKYAISEINQALETGDKFLVETNESESRNLEQRIFFDMLTPSMRSVVQRMGGTRMDNLDAQPAEWKTDDPNVDIWIYGEGTSRKVYRFVGGVLSHQ